MTVILNARYLGEKEQAHEYLRKTFDFPPYYGNNLDALADCLGEYRDLRVIICNTEAAGEYLERVLRVFRDHTELKIV